MPSKRESLTPTQLDGLIHVIRGQRVMLDSDLAVLYGVPTKVLNQAVQRNRKRFPPDFAYQLTLKEFEDLRSQIVTSNEGRGGRRYRPRAFTEQGVAMLSSVLHSPLAIQVNIEIMRAFVRLRRLLATPGDLIVQIQRLAEIAQLHDRQIKIIMDQLQKMLEPPLPPKGRFGFHMPESTP